MRPLIGLTGRPGRGSQLRAPSAFEDCPLDIYFREYAESVLRAGGLPVHIPLSTHAADTVQRLDGIVFSGGGDIDSRLYSQAPGEHSGPFSPERDALELDLLRAALTHDVPVLGICRGAQLINVAQGGTLRQHLPAGTGESHGSFTYPRAHRVHEVSFTPGSRAYGVYGARTMVNSFHHQAVDTPGSDVLVVGTASDGVIEAIELRGRPVLGVQWHPECLDDDPAFGWLIECSTTTQHSKDES